MSGFTCTECGWHGEEPARITMYAAGDLQPFNLIVCPECRYIKSSLRQTSDCETNGNNQTDGK